MVKLTIRSSTHAAVTITREAVKSEKLVYVAVSNRLLNYEHGRSRIAYIGTTRQGAHRMAASAAAKAQEMLDLHGVKELCFYTVTCRSRQNVRSWAKLERALLLAFREKFGEVPECNTQGGSIEWTDELKYFTRQRLESVIQQYSA